MSVHLREREIERKTGEGRVEGTQGRERDRKTEGKREGESKRRRDGLMGRKNNREREGDRWQKRDKEKSKRQRQRHRERDSERVRGRHRRQAVGTAGATGRGHGTALRIPSWAPLLLMGMLTTGKWGPGLVI